MYSCMISKRWTLKGCEMNKLGNYVYVECIDELRRQKIQENEFDIFVIGLGIFHNAQEVTYPHVFKKCAIGEYEPCSKDDMKKIVSIEIRMLKDRIKGYEILSDKLEKVSE